MVVLVDVELVDVVEVVVDVLRTESSRRSLLAFLLVEHAARRISAAAAALITRSARVTGLRCVRAGRSG
jgi:hypothetical protein